MGKSHIEAFFSYPASSKEGYCLQLVFSNTKNDFRKYKYTGEQGAMKVFSPSQH